MDQRLDALSGLRSKLTTDLEKSPGAHRVLDGKFMSVQQAVGCVKRAEGDEVVIDYLRGFIAQAKDSGLIQQLIDKHGVGSGLSVAD